MKITKEAARGMRTQQHISCAAEQRQSRTRWANGPSGARLVAKPVGWRSTIICIRFLCSLCPCGVRPLLLLILSWLTAALRVTLTALFTPGLARKIQGLSKEERQARVMVQKSHPGTHITIYKAWLASQCCGYQLPLPPRST